MPGDIRQEAATAIHASPVAEPLKNRVYRGLIIGLAASLVMALIGALGTGQAPFAQRLLYWSAVILPGSLLGLAITAAVQSWGGLAGRPWAQAALVSLLVAVPHTFLVIVASALMFGVTAITPQLVLQFGFAVLIVTAAMTSINYLAARADHDRAPAASAMVQPATQQAAAPADADPEGGQTSLPPAFAARLPLRLRNGRLRAISAEDHYLRVHTDLGSELVLMRMADAATLLDAYPGARVHRSWWVARHAVVASRSSNGTMVLDVEGGLEVPVSRSAKSALAAAGWWRS
jgi:DNA-binding LytR/AlgR family response regulator